MIFWSGPPQTPPPPLETHFLELLREGGVAGLKMTPPFFGSKIMNLLVFLILSRIFFFRVPTPWGLYGAEWDI